MSGRILVWDTVQLDASKIETVDDPYFGKVTRFRDVPIVREIVHEYEDGMAWKPAKELKKATPYAAMWATSGAHPPTGVITKMDEVHGRTTNQRFVKNLVDHGRTKRTNNRGILADLDVFNDRISPQLLNDMRNGKKSDVSVGFFFTKDDVKGVVDDGALKGSEYDYAQRDIMLNHLAFGLDAGRCPAPYCGIGADQLGFTADPFAGFENWEACMTHMTKPKKEGGQGYNKKQAKGTCGMLKAKHEDIDELIADSKIEEINKRVKELREKRKGIRKKIDELYDSMKGKKDPTYEKIDELHDEMNEIADEIRAYKEAKILILTRALTSEDDCIVKAEALIDKALEAKDADNFNDIFQFIYNLKADENGSVTLTKAELEKLIEFGVKLEECECDDEPEVDEDYQEWMVPYLEEDKALSYAEKKAKPDSAYAVIDPDCPKDEETGHTVQRCRHLLIHDPAHVRAALAAMSGARTGKVPPYASKAKPKVCAAAKKFKIKSEVCGTADTEPTVDELIEKSRETLQKTKKLTGRR